MFTEDTIAAIATAPGVGGVGIIRVSGAKAFPLVDALFAGKSAVPLTERPNRSIQYGRIVDPKTGRTVDEVLLLLMKGPHSYTAEDVIEIQCHGGPVVVRELLRLVLSSGARLAEPGEFTKRAFLNGRIDLTQAEAVIDIIEANGEAALGVAVGQLDGTLATWIRRLREELLTMVARLEVTIDYPEEDIEEVTTAEVAASLTPIMADMQHLLATAKSGRMVREGITTAIVGRPNAGKSSLMNALLRENRAIVTDIPGTTRDTIEEGMTIEGISLRLIDTAGIRDTEDIVEKLGVERAKEYVSAADIVVCVIDGSTALSEEEKDILETLKGRTAVVFINKADIATAITAEDIAPYGPFAAVAAISAANGEGLDVLGHVVKELVYGGDVQGDRGAMLSNIRHINLMETALALLTQAKENLEAGLSVDFIVTDMRSAWETLGDITGDSLRESMVDELFSRFCLGK